MAEKFSIKILPMQPKDLDDVLRVEEGAYGDHHWSKESFYNELNNDLARYFCAFDEHQQLIGYCGCWQIMDEAHITNIAVSIEHRRKQVGEALLTTIIDACYEEKIKYITLEVRVSNIAAIKLYEKYAFKSLGERKGYYQNNNEDALIMWTENIFYDKFKNVYKTNTKLLSEKIGIVKTK